MGCTTTSVVSDRGIQKRKYRKGFYVHKKQNIESIAKSKGIKNIEIKNDLEEFDILNIEETELLALDHSLNNQSLFKTDKLEQKVYVSKKVNNKNDECDIMTSKDGQEIKVKILEVGTDEIKYKMCDNLNGPTFTKNKFEIFMIKYPNGTSTVISSNQNNSSSNDYQNKNDEPENTTNKSQTVALILCFFIGVLGIHRFYLGHIGIGIIQLLTAGCCGVWTLIDFILILTGDLKPKKGDYGKKL